VHSKPGAWLHDTVLEHALSPVHFAHEPVPEHEIHRPLCSLPLPGGGFATNGIAGGGAGGAVGDAVTLHPLLLLSLLGVTMGCAPEPLPKAPVPALPADAAAAASAAADATKPTTDGGSSPPTAAAASAPSEATSAAPAATPLAPSSSAEPSLPQPRSREEPLPTPTQRLALYLSLVRTYRWQQQQHRAEDGSASSGVPAAPAVVLASLLAAAPADGTLAAPSLTHAGEAADGLDRSRSPLGDTTPTADAQSAEAALCVQPNPSAPLLPSVYASTFSAAEVCDLIDLLAATWQIPPRFRVYEPKGLARRWPLPTQSLKPSPVHLREAFAELKLHKEKERPVSLTGTAAAPAAPAGPALADGAAGAAAALAAAGSEIEFPWRTWQYADAPAVAAVEAGSAVDGRRAALRRRAAALALAGDVPTEDAALPSLSRDLSFEEVRRLMFSRAVCAWGECLVSEYEGRRTSNKWL
jgi:hypothetical protein